MDHATELEDLRHENGLLRAEIAALRHALGRLQRFAALYPLLVGAFILGGGPNRFSAKASLSLATPAQLAPWWLWGAALILAGLAAFTRHWQGYWAAGIIFGIFWVSLTYSVITSRAPFTGVVVYFLITLSMVHAAVSTRPPPSTGRPRWIRA